MPMTSAPRTFNNCTTIDPTPPEAAETTTVSPGPAPTARPAAYAVTPTTYRDPAASQDRPFGLATNWSAGTLTNSAWLALRSLHPSTSSPTANESASAPTRATTPARSLPSPDGKLVGNSF